MLVQILVHTLEGMFVVGGIGCFVVLGLTTIEDIRVLLGKE